jgi:hypothetical protein
MLTYGSQPDTRTVAVGIQSQLRPLGEVSITSVDDNYAAMRDLAGWDVGLSFDGTLGYTYDPGGSRAAHEPALLHSFADRVLRVAELGIRAREGCCNE